MQRGWLIFQGEKEQREEGEGEGTLQEPILLNGEEDETVAENEAAGEEETDQVIKGN